MHQHRRIGFEDLISNIHEPTRSIHIVSQAQLSSMFENFATAKKRQKITTKDVMRLLFSADGALATRLNETRIREIVSSRVSQVF